MWILLIQSDEPRHPGLALALNQQGHVTNYVSSPLFALSQLTDRPYDLVLIDVSTPIDDLRRLAHTVRSISDSVPLYVYDPVGISGNRISLWEAGATDVLSPDVSLTELLLRINLVSHKKVFSPDDRSVLKTASFNLDLDRHAIQSKDGTEIYLRGKEFLLLELFLEKQNKLVSRSMINEQVWGTFVDVSDDIINMTVSSLRKKMRPLRAAGRPSRPEIKTVRGFGYIFSSSGQTSL